MLHSKYDFVWSLVYLPKKWLSFSVVKIRLKKTIVMCFKSELKSESTKDMISDWISFQFSNLLVIRNTSICSFKIFISKLKNWNEVHTEISSFIDFIIDVQ